MTEKKVNPKNSSLGRFVTHPWFVLTLAILTVASIGFAVFTWLDNKADREIYYAVNPARALVVVRGRTSAIEVAFQGKLVTTDISAAQIAIWNAGKMPVKNADILEPIVIVTGESSPILEATIRSSTREVTRLALDDTDKKNGRIRINWNILEQNDGGVIQIIYSGNSNTNITLEGIIEGQHNPVEGKVRQTPKSPLILLLFATFAVITPIVMWFDLKPQGFVGYLLVSLSTLFFCCVVAIIAYEWFRYVTPPFVFE